MSEHRYKFNVAMSCGGCSGAVERVLKKLDGMRSPALSLSAPEVGPLLTLHPLCRREVLRRLPRPPDRRCCHRRLGIIRDGAGEDQEDRKGRQEW